MKKLSLCALTALVSSSLALGFAPQLPVSAATPASATLLVSGTAGPANSGVGDSGLGQAWGVNTTLVGSTRWTVFESSASNLVAGDTNNASDIFVTDGTTTTRLSVNATGVQGSDNFNSYDPTICANGRKVVYTTENEWDESFDQGSEDVYVIDRDADNDGVMDEFNEANSVTTSVVSVSYDVDNEDYLVAFEGANSGVISDDCTKVAFVTNEGFNADDFNIAPDVYVRDLSSPTAPLTWVTQYVTDGSTGGGYLPAISEDGAAVVVATDAPDLVSPSGTVGGLVLREAGAGTYVTRTPTGEAATNTLVDSERPAAMTPDGGCVAFKADRGFELLPDSAGATQGIYLWDNRSTEPVISLVSIDVDGFEASSASNPRISDDCRFVVYQSGDDALSTDDNNGKIDVYLYDTIEETTQLISTNVDGDSADGDSSVAALDWNPTTNDGVVLIMSSASNIGGADGGNSTIDLFSVPFSVTHDLSVTQVGNGSVSSNPSGISLSAAGSDTGTFDALDTVVLTATPASGWELNAWSGACSGTSGCSVTMSEARSVTATFTQIQRNLDVTVVGNGSVGSNPAGITSCEDTSGTCDADFNEDTQVTLTATPDAGWQFDGWTGDCSGSSTCVVTMSEARSVTAIFDPVDSPIGGLTALGSPVRLLNTRTSGTKVGALDGSGAAYELTVSGQRGIPAEDVVAVAMNVTVVDGEAGNAGGYVTVYPCGTRPDSSNLNFVNGQTVPNAVIAPVSSTGKVCFYVYGKAHLLADVSGYFTAGFTPLAAPTRLLNTRTSGVKVGKTDGTGTAYELTVAGQSGLPAAGSLSTVAMNVTVVDGEANDAGGYVTVYPCGTRPDSSNLNFVNGQTVPNAVIASVSSEGKVCFYVYGKAHLLADVSGYFDNSLTALEAPVRLLNTRTSGIKVGKTDGTGTAYDLTVAGASGLPALGMTSIALNVTVVDGEAGNAGGYVTVYPCGTRPDSSNLNFVNGQTVPNAVIAPVSNDGHVCFYVYGKAHLLVDAAGYFAAPPV